MNAVRSLHACAGLLFVRSVCTACNWVSKPAWISAGKPKLLTVVIRSLTWVAAPLTVTEKLPLAVSLPGSLALQFTVVVPMGKLLPEAGAQVATSVSPSSSVAVAVEETTAPCWLVAFTVRGLGRWSFRGGGPGELKDPMS